MLFEGAISGKAILEAGRRPVETLYIDPAKRSRDFAYIIAIAKKQGVPVEFLSRPEMDALAGSAAHGGLLLKAGSRPRLKLDRLEPGFVCYIDGVEDPFNLGSIARTLYAAGCSQLILPERDWSAAEMRILKASAGAWERLPVMYANEEEVVRACQEQNVPVIAADRKDAVALTHFSYPENFCLALGGALRGLGRKIREAAQERVYITYGREFRNALDTASSTAVFAFEYVRQKENGGI